MAVGDKIYIIATPKGWRRETVVSGEKSFHGECENVVVMGVNFTADE